VKFDTTHTKHLKKVLEHTYRLKIERKKERKKEEEDKCREHQLFWEEEEAPALEVF
jgi:hypothetical protein